VALAARFVRVWSFRNAKFPKLGARGGWVPIFGRVLQKAHPRQTPRVLSYCMVVWGPSPGFTAFDNAKKGIVQKVTAFGLFPLFGGIPHPTKFNETWHVGMGPGRNQSCQVSS